MGRSYCLKTFENLFLEIPHFDYGDTNLLGYFNSKNSFKYIVYVRPI